MLHRLLLAATAALTLAASAAALEAPKPAKPEQRKLEPPPGQPRVLEWDDLLPANERDRPFMPPARPYSLFDDESGPPALQEGSGAVNAELEGQKVKLPGFVVPLDVDKDARVSTLLLVPYFGACIHVPPPPPNQIVYVRMQRPFRLTSMWEPVWIIGEMSTQKASTDLAAASYTLHGTEVEAYVE